jgi:hypothetical protein
LKYSLISCTSNPLLPQAHFSKRVERGGGYRARAMGAMAMAGTSEECQGMDHLNAQVKAGGSVQ